MSELFERDSRWAQIEELRIESSLKKMSSLSSHSNHVAALKLLVHLHYGQESRPHKRRRPVGRPFLTWATKRTAMVADDATLATARLHSE